MIAANEGTGDEEMREHLALMVSLFENPPASAAGSAVVKRVFSGIEEMTGTTLDVGITSVDLEKSFLVFSYTTDNANPNSFQVKGSLDAANNINFKRDTAGSTVYIAWYVAEFESGVFVQRNNFDVTGATQTISLPTSIDDATSFILGSIYTSGTSWDGNDNLRMRLINNGDDIESDFNSAPSGGTDDLHWQAIEYAGAQVQRNNFAMGGATSDQGITAVNLNKTFVLSTFSLAGGILVNPDDAGLETDLDAEDRKSVV